MQPTKATHRRAPSWEGYFHSAVCLPGVIWAMPHSQIVPGTRLGRGGAVAPPLLKGAGPRGPLPWNALDGSATLVRRAAATARTAPSRDPRAADRVAEA